MTGNGGYRAFRVRPGNRLGVENLVFRNCLGSEYGAAPQPNSDGGAILNYGSLSVSNCVFVGNSTGRRLTNYPVGYGGAVATEGGATTTVWRTTFDGNIAVRGGALYTAAGGFTRVACSTFGRNVADGSTSDLPAGGAIYCDQSSTNAPTWLVNCTLVDNSVPSRADAGGGIFAKGGLVLLDSIVLGNRSKGMTNDISIASSGSGVRGKFVSTAYGTRTAENGYLKFEDVSSYKVDRLGDFIADTNAMEEVSLMPHILYPFSTEISYSALTVRENFAENAIGYVYTNGSTVAISGRRSAVVRGKTIEADQLGNPESDAFFGATVMPMPPVIDVSPPEEEEGGEPVEPAVTEEESVAKVVDCNGETTYYRTVAEAIDAYRAGDVIDISGTGGDAEVDAIFDSLQNELIAFAEAHPWFTYEETDTGISLTLNDEATPVATEVDMEWSDSYVRMTPANLKPGLWYALAVSDSLTDGFEAFEWQQARAPDEFHDEPWFRDPLIAPKHGTGGFYRVVVAPYEPTK